jgi:hypothetical protein
MKTASRTLVKSPPELWEMIDQPDRMQGLMSGLLGKAAEVSVSERDEGALLCWEATDADEYAWIKVKLAEKGWGTHVEVSAASASEPVKLEGWLDAVLDELATPQKRPFQAMSEPHAPPSIEDVPEPEPEPVEEAPAPEAVEEAVEDEAVDDEPVEESPAADQAPEPVATEPAPAPAPPKKRRRFLIF